MKNPFQEFTRYSEWKERYLKDRDRIKEINPKPSRLSEAIASMYVGGLEHRTQDEEIKKWTDWAGEKTYRTFNGFPQLS
ncbi:MAG: hypothetical protein NZ527_06895, partial [Hydrogenobacter thermophilus]|nr:hypothetical protein [Hydrogenobacter thermophilus]